MNKFTEEKLEQVFIELLENEGSPHHSGSTISRDENEVIIEEDLKKFLLIQYKNDSLTNIEAQSIILSLKTLSSSELYESNKTIMRWLKSGETIPIDKKHNRSYNQILKDCIG